MIDAIQEWKIGDCLDLLPGIPDKSIDMILTDLPYGNTQNVWDMIINPPMLWLQYNRIIKDNGAIVLFGQGMFTAMMMQSNSNTWRYNLIWDKIESTGFLNASRMPLRCHEDVMVFYKKLPVFNPQKHKGRRQHTSKSNAGNNNYGSYDKTQYEVKYCSMKSPKSIIKIQKPHSSITIHPTEKPVVLFEYLIKTYTNIGDTVHDSCLGSGTTLEACMNTNRNCIGFEISDEWVPHYNKRLMSDNSKLTDAWG